MSDYPSESQLRASNNDGMDPYWVPDIKVKISVGNKIDNVINIAQKISDIPLKHGQSVFELGAGYSVQMTIPASWLQDLKRALEMLSPEGEK